MGVVWEGKTFRFVVLNDQSAFEGTVGVLYYRLWAGRGGETSNLGVSLLVEYLLNILNLEDIVFTLNNPVQSQRRLKVRTKSSGLGNSILVNGFDFCLREHLCFPRFAWSQRVYTTTETCVRTDDNREIAVHAG